MGKRYYKYHPLNGSGGQPHTSRINLSSSQRLPWALRGLEAEKLVQLNCTRWKQHFLILLLDQVHSTVPDLLNASQTQNLDDKLYWPACSYRLVFWIHKSTVSSEDSAHLLLNGYRQFSLIVVSICVHHRTTHRTAEDSEPCDLSTVFQWQGLCKPQING